MPELTLAQLAEATGGTLVRGNPEHRVDSYVINTRVLRPGGAFFALEGTRTDGHRFLADAAKRRAEVAVIARELGDSEAAPPGVIQVDDTRAAMGRCGSWLRSHIAPARWLAITGSNGKTTTKELLAAGLSARHKVHRTLGNFNNDLGVPLTLLACPGDAEYVVLELAMSAAGEIAELAKMTDPDIGLVTNVRAVHLQYFNSLDDIAAAKGELFAVLRDDATSVVNIDDAQIRVQAARHAGPRVTFGMTPEADLHLEQIRGDFLRGAGLTIRHQERRYEMQLKLGGGHSAFNAVAACACLVAAGEELEPAMEKMEQLEPGEGRGRVHHLDRGLVVVDDSYNSSPAALASVLETMQSTQTDGRKVLVMGDMLELGTVEGALHREAGKRAASAGINVLVAVGSLARQAADSARRSGVPEVHLHADSARCAEELGEYLQPGDLVVIKGSRGVRMDKIVGALLSTLGGDA